MSNPVQITAAIITYNEEKNIARCVGSIADLVDEVLVIDSYSTDNTAEICKNMGVRLIQHPFEGHIQQKNFAIDQAEYDVILSLDADEALDEEARAAVRMLKSNWKEGAYRFNRLTNYCGQWIRHGGWYPDKKTRLFDRRRARWGGENPHDRVMAFGGIPEIDLKVNILHFAIPSISRHALTANNFSEIASKEAIAKNQRIYFVYHILLNPFFTFIKKYFLQLGFLDGYYGFVIAILSAHSNFLKYAKIWSLKKGHENNH